MGYPANPTMKIYITDKHFIIQTPDLGASYQLIIEKQSGQSFCSEKFNPLENGASRNRIFYLDIFLIVGTVPIDSILYLIVVTAANIIDTIKDQNIYEIKQVELIPEVYRENNSENHVSQIQNISRLLSSGFYFSYYYDLTNSLNKKVIEGNLHERADKSFYWNYELYRDFINQGVDTQWLTPIIQGYVGIYTVNHDNSTIMLALISRRSCDRTGTRYNCRGLDDEGNVANYVETEQILISGKYVFSHIQVRGSVPLFWEQTGMSAQISLTRSREMNSIGFRKHADQLLEKFPSVTMVNLLSNLKTEEKYLTDAWEELLPSINNAYNNRVLYHYFDFHQCCKGNKYLNLNAVIADLQDFISYYMFYMEFDGIQQYKQKGVVRTNCLDCLDRTNVMQSYIGWAVLVDELKAININIPYTIENSVGLAISKSFKNLWADNGDALSVQYTGTGSTISSVTREGGKQGFRGLISHGLVSLGRFYNANVEDAARQKSIDSVLRKRGKLSNMTVFDKAVAERESEFVSFNQFTLRAVTWNLAGRKIPPDSDFTSILMTETPADIIIVVFQEVVNLNPRNVLQEGNNQGAIDNLSRIIERSLFNLDQGYSPLCQSNLVGIGLFIYAKKHLCKYITKIETDTVKVGFGGKMGNKGGVAGRFSLFDTNICVLGCHLASGNEENDARKSQLVDIHNRAFQQEKIGRQNIYNISEHDIKLICGDLNFRVPLNNYNVRNTIREGNYKFLLKSDQLIEALKKKEIPGYNECEINFPPTYKYDFGTNIYDTSKKQRTPAWCDRVLYSGENIEPILYNFVDLRLSDHRPVYAEFNMIAKTIDENAKKLVEEDIYSQIIPEEEPQKKSRPETVDLLSL